MSSRGVYRSPSTSFHQHRLASPSPRLSPNGFGHSVYSGLSGAGSPVLHASGPRAIDQLSKENIELDFRVGREAQERTKLQTENQRLLSTAISERNRSTALVENHEYLLRNEMAIKADLKARLKENIEEFRRKDSQISDLSCSNDELIQKNRALTRELARLRAELQAKENVISNLETKITVFIADAEKQHRDYLIDSDQVKEEFNSSVGKMRQNYERKIEIQEENLRDLAVAKDKLEREVFELKGELERRTNFHVEEMKSFERDLIEKQENMYIRPIRDMEIRIRTAENEKNEALRRLEGALEEARIKDRQLRESDNTYPHEIERLRLENENLRRDLRDCLGGLDHIQADSDKKTWHLSQAQAKLDHIELAGLHSSEIFKHNMGVLRSHHGNDLAVWEHNERALLERNHCLEEVLRDAEREIIYLRAEYKRLVDMLHSNLSMTIDSTLLNHANFSPDVKRTIMSSQFLA